MTTGTSRGNIVLAKYLYVATMSAVAGLLNITAMVLSMKSVLAPLAGRGLGDLSFRIPLTALPLIAFVTVLLALFIAAGMMILASFARTFKEGQSMVTPFYLATFMPVMFLQVPGIELTPALALIPVVNVALVFREAIAGLYRWPEIAITIGVEAACVALALWLATAILRHEDLMLGSYGGTFGKFVKERILRSGKKSGGGR
jgi:sodium transport system permease protein